MAALAIDPRTPDTLYAGIPLGPGTAHFAPAVAYGVFKSTDGGANWSAFNEGLTNLFVLVLAIDPQTPDTLYAGTDGSGVFVFSGGSAPPTTPSPKPILRPR